MNKLTWIIVAFGIAGIAPVPRAQAQTTEQRIQFLVLLNRQQAENTRLVNLTKQANLFASLQRLESEAPTNAKRARQIAQAEQQLSLKLRSVAKLILHPAATPASRSLQTLQKQLKRQESAVLSEIAKLEHAKPKNPKQARLIAARLSQDRQRETMYSSEIAQINTMAATPSTPARAMRVVASLRGALSI